MFGFEKIVESLASFSTSIQDRVPKSILFPLSFTCSILFVIWGHTHGWKRIVDHWENATTIEKVGVPLAIVLVFTLFAAFLSELQPFVTRAFLGDWATFGPMHGLRRRNERHFEVQRNVEMGRAKPFIDFDGGVSQWKRVLSGHLDRAPTLKTTMKLRQFDPVPADAIVKSKTPAVWSADSSFAHHLALRDIAQNELVSRKDFLAPGDGEDFAQFDFVLVDIDKRRRAMNLHVGDRLLLAAKGYAGFEPVNAEPWLIVAVEQPDPSVSETASSCGITLAIPKIRRAAIDILLTSEIAVLSRTTDPGDSESVLKSTIQLSKRTKIPERAIVRERAGFEDALDSSLDGCLTLKDFSEGGLIVPEDVLFPSSGEDFADYSFHQIDVDTSGVASPLRIGERVLVSIKREQKYEPVNTSPWLIVDVAAFPNKPNNLRMWVGIQGGVSTSSATYFIRSRCSDVQLKSVERNEIAKLVDKIEESWKERIRSKSNEGDDAVGAELARLKHEIEADLEVLKERYSGAPNSSGIELQCIPSLRSLLNNEANKNSSATNPYSNTANPTVTPGRGNVEIELFDRFCSNYSRALSETHEFVGSLIADVQKRVASQFSRDHFDIAATRAGNIVLAANKNLEDAYGTRIDLILPVLTDNLTDQHLQSIKAADDRLSLLQWTWIGFFFLATVGSGIAITGGSLTWAVIFWFGALIAMWVVGGTAMSGATRSYADAVQLACIHDRSRVLEFFGLSLPKGLTNPNDEKALWRAVHQQIVFGAAPASYRLNPGLSKSTPSDESGS